VGPASDATETLAQLLEAGVNVFRLNFSHGAQDSHRETIARIREASRLVGKDAAILQDLCGPKIRVGLMENGAVTLAADSEVVVTTEQITGTPRRIPTQYRDLPKDVTPGERLLLDDGAMELQVLGVSGNEITTRVTRGGILKNNKGMNLPDINVSAPSVTEKDLNDLKLGLSEGVDFIALSFIRRAEDMDPVRLAMRNAYSRARLIAKIEKPEAMEHIEDIVKSADGIMVARGDLGIEMPIQRVPIMQKKLIRLANANDRYVITATQMLESMTLNALPTRAEVSDVANAIVDGTDAVMLSGETAVGVDPVRTVEMMASIARETEGYLAQFRPTWNWCDRVSSENPLQDALGHAAFKLVEDLDIKAVAVHTQTGGTALFMSKARPFAPILAFTPDAGAARRLNLYWGVTPVYAPGIQGRSELLVAARRELLERKIVKPGDRILLVTGTAFGQIGSADAILVATVSED
jgi:pyruvate kinase